MDWAGLGSAVVHQLWDAARSGAALVDDALAGASPCCGQRVENILLEDVAHASALSGIGEQLGRVDGQRFLLLDVLNGVK